MSTFLGKKKLNIVRKTFGYVYADIEIEFDSKNKIDLDPRGLKLLILNLLKNLYGDLGASIPVDILKFNKKSFRVYLRFPSSFAVHVQSALTLMYSYNNHPCRINILKICHSLTSLPLESNHQIHSIEA